jgi:hypothetical protein
MTRTSVDLPQSGDYRSVGAINKINACSERLSNVFERVIDRLVTANFALG